MDQELSPTVVFIQVHGNYGGLGNRGGQPVDALDTACMHHDCCYLNHGRNNPECDAALVREVRAIKPATLRERFYAFIIICYFTIGA